MLIRSWNLFHGNTVPPRRQGFLDEAVKLATADEPDVVCLQEVPAWALSRLAQMSGMQSFPALAAHPMLGPLPIPAEVGRWLTAPNSGLLRSAFAGQGNAILVEPALRVSAHETIVLNPRDFRRAQARWLELDLLARIAWARERRVCQTVRIELPNARRAVVANLHATSYWPDQRLPDAELLRAAKFAATIAALDDILVLAGDFNVDGARSRTLADLTGPDWRFSAPGPGIDHILVRGAHVRELRVWQPDRRAHDGALLSDHAPVEVEIA